MPNDTSEVRSEAAPVHLAWGVHAIDAPEVGSGTGPLWLAGGACLLLWTALALLLTTS